MANIYELNQFGKNITDFKVGRSSFPLDNENVLTLKAGDIVPVWHLDVIPGDTIQVGFNFVMRMLTPISPIMDNSFIDFYSFYISNRRLCELYHLTTTDEGYVDEYEEYGDWKTFFQENENGAWAPEETTYLKQYAIAQVTPQSLADYLGYPLGKCNTANLSDLYKNGKLDTELPNNYPYKTGITNGLPFAAVDLIYNEWFRNENLEAPTIFRQNGEIGTEVNEITGTTTTIGNYGYINKEMTLNDNAYTYRAEVIEDYPYKATKYSDMFTNCLPEPYKLDTSVILGLANEAEITLEDIPVMTKEGIAGATIDDVEESLLQKRGALDTSTNQIVYDDLNLYAKGADGTSQIIAKGTAKANLTDATAITINELRNAITIQHIAEAFARGGTRYSEVLHAIYGTAPSDDTLGRPELLGAKRYPVNTTQVVNSAITNTGDLGELGAYSHTVGSDEYIISKSFKEFGQLFIFAVIRTSNKYYQGIPKEYSKYRLFDYYFPQFQGLGEQAVLNKEIYLSGNNTTDNEVFGYQEAFYEMHYKKDELHGYVNPVSGDKTLASYTYQVPFTKTPVLNKDFDTQQYENVGNVLYDTTTNSQFLLDIYFNVKAVREMPIHSIPGVDRI